MRRFGLALVAAIAALSASVARAQQSDILVTKVGPATAAAGTDVAYTVTVTNLGPDASAAVTLNDPIPAGMTFVSLSQTGPAFACTDPGVGNPGTVNCTIASLANAAATTFTMTFHIPIATPAGTSFTNIATSACPTDPSEENDAGVAVTMIPVPTADVLMLKTGPSVAGPNTNVTYTITFVNAGPDAALGASWADTLPGTMTFVSLVQNSGPPMGTTTPAVGAGGTVTATLASFAPGAATFTLVGHIPAGTASGTTFANTAVAATTTFDPDNNNDSAFTSLRVSAVDVGVTKLGPPTANAATDVAYALQVTNAGPDTALSVQLLDAIPAPATFVALVQNTGPAAVCTTPPAGSSGLVTCTWASLGSGATADFTLTINTRSAVTITNTATVAVGDSFDTNGANDSSTAVTNVAQSADLAVAKTGPATILDGGNGTYVVTVTNAGPSDAANVSFADALPAPLRFVSLVQNAGPAFACATPAVGANGTITCGPATLPAGGSATFTIVLQLAPGAVPVGTPITNTVNASSTTADPTTGNESASTTATSAPGAQVATSIPTLSTWAMTVLGLAFAALGLRLLRRT